MMPSLKLSLILISTLSSLSSHAQDNNASPACSTITPFLHHNASASLPIPALDLVYLGSDPTDVGFRDEPDFNWTLTSYIQPLTNTESSSPNDTQTVVWLDTGASNTTRLGDRMRMCHSFVPLQIGNRNLTWSHETLEKSVGDNGDCRSLVSEECLDALRVQYRNSAVRERSRNSQCSTLNTTVPLECVESGMVAPTNNANPEFNATLASRFPTVYNASAALGNVSDPLVCDGRNFSTQFGTFATFQDYDVGTNFPLMDIMTFIPTARPGQIGREDMQRVQIACLLPGQVTEGSRAKASVQSVLDSYDSTGGDQKAGAMALVGVDAWKLLAWVVGVGFMCAV